MYNLQQKYKKVKILNNTSGQGKNFFPFYEEIDKVLGHKPSINPLSTLSSIVGGSSSRSDMLDTLETESVLSSVDGMDEDSFLCEAVTEGNVSVNGSEDEDTPTLPTSEKKSEPEKNESKNRAGKIRKQPKSTPAEKMERFIEKFFRSEEHTSELQSRQYLVCRLLLEKKNTLPHTNELHYHL